MPSMSLSLPPLSLYVHVPWCVRKCPYCDFNSHERAELPVDAYLEALLEDLAPDLPLAQGRPVATVFFGGGTPSLMPATFYATLLARLRDLLPFAPDAEITLEANPGTAEAARFEGYRAAGINRLSIGVQSFDRDQLVRLGRIHGPEEAVAALRMARAAGFDNVNLDLMHGLPEQTPAQALADLEQAIALAPEHLSWYELTIEPNTVFFRQPPGQPDSDVMAEIEEAGFRRLAAAGYTRYEVSAFARPGRRARHNLNYWRFGDYLALGAGAHGKITLPDEGRILRYSKTRLPEHYLAGSGSRTRGSTDIEPDARTLEYFMNTLRLCGGAPAGLFPARTGLPLEEVAPQLAALRARGLLADDPEHVRCTDLGLAHLNTVLAAFE